MNNLKVTQSMTDWHLTIPNAVDFESEVVRSIYLGNLFQYSRGRSAWFGFWSSQYSGEHSFHPEIDEVMSRVEEERTSGSRWTIIEIPTLVFAGDGHALAVVEINTHEPFREAKMRALERPPLAGFAETLRSEKRDSIWQFFIAKGRIEPTTAPFHRYASVSAGSNYTLGWNPSRETYDLRWARLLIQNAQRRLKKLAGGATS